MSKSLSENLHDLTRDELITLFGEWDYSAFYAALVWNRLYRQQIDSFDSMNLQNAGLWQFLTDNARMTVPRQIQKVQSQDSKTIKYFLSMEDGEAVEAVLMYFRGRATACISTQSGCAMGCVFCATGQLGFRRHLKPGEIVGQALHIIRDLERHNQELRNIVLMGMGEPLHNYRSTMTAIDILTDHHGLAIGPRYITLSTVGIPHAIRRLADESRSVNLAVSLHAASDEDRNRLVPAGKKWPLAVLMDACRYYTSMLNRRIFFEWALIAGTNDSPEQAHLLAKLLSNMNAHVNLIPLNLTKGYDGQASDACVISSFQSILADHGIPSTVRQRRGLDIAAGCGQLRANINDSLV